MIITKKNTIEQNIKRLTSFFEILSPTMSFLQSDNAFSIKEVFHNNLSGMCVTQSMEMMSNFDKKTIKGYFKHFINDEDCTVDLIEYLQPNIPFLVLPIEYKDVFPAIFYIEKPVDIENNLFIKDIGSNSYIDYAYNNAEYHYAHYMVLDYMYNRLINDIHSSKFILRDINFGDKWFYGYFSNTAQHYKNNIVRFGLLSNKKEIQERAKMIITSTELLFCEESFTEPHRSARVIDSEFFAQGGKIGRSCGTILSDHVNDFIGEIRAIHNPLFEHYMAK